MPFILAITFARRSRLILSSPPAFLPVLRFFCLKLYVVFILTLIYETSRPSFVPEVAVSWHVSLSIYFCETHTRARALSYCLLINKKYGKNKIKKKTLKNASSVQRSAVEREQSQRLSRCQRDPYLACADGGVSSLISFAPNRDSYGLWAQEPPSTFFSFFLAGAKRRGKLVICIYRIKVFIAHPSALYSGTKKKYLGDRVGFLSPP